MKRKTTHRRRKHIHKRRHDIGKCSYHLCGKRTKVFHCKYCHDYFCKEHINPKPPGMPHFAGGSETKEHEWRATGHPCPDYTEYYKRKQELDKERYRESLDRLIKSKPVSHEPPPETDDNLPTWIPPWERPKKDDYVEESEHEPVIEEKKPRNKIIFILILIIGFAITGAYGYSYYISLGCDDGTMNRFCSDEKPYLCVDGELIENASLCGCPHDYRANGDVCEKIQRCKDGTEYGKCSSDKPMYCEDGSLIKKASQCGCKYEYVAIQDNCISKYLVSPKERDFEYLLDGESNSISFTVYKGLNDYLASLPRSYYCDPVCPSDRELQLKFLNEKHQTEFLIPFVWKIQNTTNDKDDQARVAISLVQHIPYDYSGALSLNKDEKYPFQVLYSNTGVCGEKSKLLAFLLRELGFGVILFEYAEDSHQSVGIKCPDEYSMDKTGYCFVESTVPSIITDDQGDYVGVGTLGRYEIIKISDGDSFDSVYDEYRDARRLIELNQKSEANDGMLYWADYNEWENLIEKYGIQLSG